MLTQVTCHLDISHLELHLELRYSVTQFAAQGCRPVGRTVGFVAKV